MAKDSVMDACTRDNVYYQQALKDGYILSEEELDKIEEQAVEEMNKLTESQLKITEYQLSDMIEVLTKIAYARNYVQELMVEGYTSEELDTGGSKYKEIAKDYSVKVDKKIWRAVRLGKVTINNS